MDTRTCSLLRRDAGTQEARTNLQFEELPALAIFFLDHGASPRSLLLRFLLPLSFPGAVTRKSAHLSAPQVRHLKGKRKVKQLNWVSTHWSFLLPVSGLREEEQSIQRREGTPCSCKEERAGYLFELKQIRREVAQC